MQIGNVCYLSHIKLHEIHRLFMYQAYIDKDIESTIHLHVLIPRINGFKKQTDILRQKHTEFVEKYKLTPGAGGEDK